MTPSSEDDQRPWMPGRHIRRTRYFVVLNDPIGFPAERTFHRSTYIPLGRLADIPSSVSVDAPTDPDELLYGQISISVHQGILRSFPAEAARALFEVAKAQAVEVGWIPEAAVDPPSDDGDVTESENGDEDEDQDRWTIAEISIEDYGISEWMTNAINDGELPDWLTQGLWALEELVRSYRIVARAPIAELAYRSMFPLVVSFDTDLDDNPLSPPLAWPLESAGLGWVSSSIDLPHLTANDQLDAIESTADRLSKGDPFARYSDRIWRAERNLHIEGKYDVAVLEAAIAIEGLLVGSRLAIQWEKGASAREAMTQARRLSADRPIKSVLGWLSNEIGGAWDPVNRPESKRWIEELQVWRNQVVHAGERLSRTEGQEAVSIARSLAEFLKLQLLKNFRHYPRVALLMAGQHDAANIVSVKRITRFLSSVEEEPPFYESLSEWLKVEPDAQQHSTLFEASGGEVRAGRLRVALKVIATWLRGRGD